MPWTLPDTHRNQPSGCYQDTSLHPAALSSAEVQLLAYSQCLVSATNRSSPATDGHLDTCSDRAASEDIRLPGSATATNPATGLNSCSAAAEGPQNFSSLPRLRLPDSAQPGTGHRATPAHRATPCSDPGASQPAGVRGLALLQRRDSLHDILWLDQNGTLHAVDGP